jgi:hypothetical protein
MRPIVCAVFVLACGNSPIVSTDAGELGDSTTFDPGDAGVDAADASAAIVSIDLSPKVLVPPFSPTTTDYAVRCAVGTNNATLTVTYAGGAKTTTPEALHDDDLVTVDGTYFIRCLPHDFPDVTVADHPDAGARSPGYYLVNSAMYAIALDTNGTPVWYARAASVLDVESPGPNRISFTPNGAGPFGTNPATRFDVRDLASATTTSFMTVGSPTDVHDFRVLANGDALLLTYPIANGKADCEVQEIDGQGGLVWSWRATDHVDPAESLAPPTVNGVVDVFHCNAIDVDPSGNLLVSMRYPNALYYVDRTTGVIQWKLGGTASNKDGAAHIAVTSDPQGSFSAPHDGRFVAGGHVTMLDNHVGGAGVARGVEYVLDQKAKTASVVWQFLGKVQSQAEGSCRRQADGSTVISWGHALGDPRVITEVDGSGAVLFEVTFKPAVAYRGVKVPLAQFDIGRLRSTTAK